MASLPSSPETRGLLPSESQRIPCLPRNDWQLLDNAAQKAVATVSMIDCLWEKLTKVSDDLETLQQRLQALEPAPAAPAAPEPPSRGEMDELMKVCGSLAEATEAQFREVRQFMQQKLDDLSDELAHVKETAAEDKSSSAVLQLNKEVESLKGALEAQEQRLDQRIQNIQSSVDTLELKQSSATERQMQDNASQEQNLKQVKQLLVDICDEAFNNLRRLESSLQTEAALRHGAQQISSQQIDGLQQRMEAVEGQQLKFLRTSEETRRLIDAQEETRRTLEQELHCIVALDGSGIKAELASLQKQLQAHKQESADRSTQLSQELIEHSQQATKLSQDRQRLQQEVFENIGKLKEEVAERLQELAHSELTQRAALEERSNGLLDLGLQKLAQEVATRMDQLFERQHAAAVASESRFGHLESWQNSIQEKDLAREVQVKTMGEQLQRMEGSCKEISLLKSRMEEQRHSIEEGLAASAMNAFQGEMRLWAKMAQFGMPQ